MKNTETVAYKFVDAIPEKLEEMTVYVSVEYATAVHKCCCGCKKEVVTPLSPTDWKLTFDGVSVSLAPSIGNWSFNCQSHYWIVNNAVKWTGQISPELIEAERTSDRHAKTVQFEKPQNVTNGSASKTSESLWPRLWNWLSGN